MYADEMVLTRTCFASFLRSRRAAMIEARARKEEAQHAKQQEGLALLAKAQEEAAEAKKRAAEQRQRWRADYQGKTGAQLETRKACTNTCH